MGRTILPSRFGGIAIPQTSTFSFSSSFHERERGEKRNWVLTASHSPTREGGVLSGGACRSFRLPSQTALLPSWRMVSRVAEPVRGCPANERGVRSILWCGEAAFSCASLKLRVHACNYGCGCVDVGALVGVHRGCGGEN